MVNAVRHTWQGGGGEGEENSRLQNSPLHNLYWQLTIINSKLRVRFYHESLQISSKGASLILGSSY